MTVGEWLSARTPAPPEPLASRLRAALGSRLDERSSAAFDAALSTSERMLAEMLALRGAGRDHALDLLAVDALVTYAFEAATEEPDTLSARATAAMSSVAALATTSPHA